MAATFDSMTVAELQAWASRHGMVLVPLDEYAQLIADVTAALVAQVDAHNKLEVEHMNLLRPEPPRHQGEVGCSRPSADSKFLGTRLARRLAQHLQHSKLFKLRGICRRSLHVRSARK